MEEHRVHTLLYAPDSGVPSESSSIFLSLRPDKGFFYASSRCNNSIYFYNYYKKNDPLQ